MKFLEIGEDAKVALATASGSPELVHVFDQPSIHAINAALGARRPLLVRGEPGVGKSQLARAAAKCLGRAYVQQVVDSRTEARELLWHFDAVARLAEAQLAGACNEDPESARQRLAVERFIHPAALWWAFDWQGAIEQATLAGTAPPAQPDGGNATEGTVVLIDEIDKAETDVPNGLLEALGSGEFTPQGRSAPVKVGKNPPLVLITTNEERALPDAFVRRCLVLYLSLAKDREKLIADLCKRGQAHFSTVDDAVLRAAAEQVATDRQTAREKRRTPLPGQAEYLDLLRAVQELAPADSNKQVELLQTLRSFVLQKHAGNE